jgi:heme-degrading monooxygenase HmoA
MIARIWNGDTSNENADKYENLLRTEVFHWIASKEIKGYNGIQLLRKEHTDETAFTTIMWFDEIQNIIDFAGEDYEKAVVLPEAQALLKRYDDRSAHYEVVIDKYK